jgi:hypothetical protein
MVFVAVSNKDTTNALLLIIEVVSIRDDEVNTQHFIIREH